MNSVQNKVGVPSQQKGETPFANIASKVASLFKKLPDYTEDVNTELYLFKSAVISSAAVSSGCKHVGGQMGSEKRTSWWNQEVKEAIHAKKTAFKAWLTNTSTELL